jgi:hypothetical protein
VAEKNAKRETSPFAHLAIYYYHDDDEIKHEEEDRKKGKICFGMTT